MTNVLSKKRLGSGAALLGLCLWSITAGASAQSLFPNQNQNGSLQPQASTNQQAANTQNQTGTLQENNGGVLDQSAQQPLGVVSSPNQTNPDAVVQPSNTLTADRVELNDTSIWPYVAAASLFAALIGIYMLRKDATTEKQTKTEQIQPEPVIESRPKSAKPRKTHKKPHGNARKKKRK